MTITAQSVLEQRLAEPDLSPEEVAIREAKAGLFEAFFTLFPNKNHRQYAMDFASYLIGDKRAMNMRALSHKVGLMLRRQVFEIVKESGAPILRDPKC